MVFKIGDNSVNKSVTLEQLTQGLDKVKDAKKIDRITLIFNRYNTNTNKSSSDALDLNEQVAFMNDMHKADGDGKGKDFDGKISKKGLKKAGLEAEYKAYKDFAEAYQKAVGDKNTFDLTFKDGTIDGKAFVETTAERKGTIDGKEFTEQHQYINNDKAKLTRQTADGTFSYDPIGRLTKQITSDNQTVIYKAFTSDAKNATAGVIVTRDKDNNRAESHLQDDGTYQNKADNSLYKLNDKGIPEKYTPPVVEDKSDIETSKDASETVEKPKRPSSRKLVPMTAGWKNQKVKLDDDTKAKFNAMSKADEVLADLIKDKADGLDIDKLCADLIKNNPSVFDPSTGQVYSDARWDRLDLPKDLRNYVMKK